MLRIRLKRNDFSIVSNNCWGGHIHQKIGNEYRSPFVGLYLAPECYLKLLKSFPASLAAPLTFAETSRHAYVNSARRNKNDHSPIGLLGDGIELHFIHYESEAEARDKWQRRLQRMEKNVDRIFFKFDDRDGCTPEQLREFDLLPFRNKVCFVSRPNLGLKCGVWIPDSTEGQVPDGRVLGMISPHYFDGADWLNGGIGRPRWPAWARPI